MSNNTNRNFEKYYRVAMRLTQSAYASLLATIFYGCWIQNIDNGTPGATAMAKLTLWLLLCSGLLLVAKGIAQGVRRSYQWLCFILLLYFVFSVQLLFSGTGAEIHKVLSLFFIIVSFIGAMLTSRWQPRNDR